MLHERLRKVVLLPKAELDEQLSPSLSAKDANGVLAAHARATKRAALSATNTAHLNVAYGPRRRQTLDIFVPRQAGERCPCFAFIHGGFWQEGSKEVLRRKPSHRMGLHMFRLDTA